MSSEPLYPLAPILRHLGLVLSASGESSHCVMQGFMAALAFAHAHPEYAAVLHRQMPEEVRASGDAMADALVQFFPLEAVPS